ncbi:MAG: S8 family peptidase, partial [Melioribacteraceae bacterium]
MKTNISIFLLLLCLALGNPLFSQVVINDSLFYKQWYLNMSGDDNTRADIRVLDAWSRTMGNSNQKIADIEGDDSGANGYPLTSHDDLLGRITTQGYGLIGEHSTNVAGLLVANHNTIGIAGVNKYAQLYSYVYSDVAQWADKVRDARLDGNKIINISQGLYDPMTNVWEQLVEAYNGNIVTVVSAGNNGTSITYPAVYSNTIAVGSSTKDNTRSSFSNYGPQIEFLAPGGTDNNPANEKNIYTTSSNGSYAYVDGTSFAAPLVSGTASLLLAYNPDLTNEDVKNILISSCDKLEEMNGNDFTIYCGYGRINLKKAMQLLEPPYTI